MVTLRLWSLHPMYLDQKGLGGVWREGLLAQKVLQGKTKGWRKHPQLSRFQKHRTPVNAIGVYLHHIHKEACRRGYSYNQAKIVKPRGPVDKIPITTGQLTYELAMLTERVKHRDPEKVRELLKGRHNEGYPRPHPLFTAVAGDVEPWETSYWIQGIHHPQPPR